MARELGSRRGLDPSISADGTRVAFTGNQMWMDEGLYSDIDSVFVYDRVAHGIHSVGSPGLGILYEHSPELSANGRYVSWRNSAATSEPIKDFGPAAERPVPAFEPFTPGMSRTPAVGVPQTRCSTTTRTATGASASRRAR